MNEQYQEDMPFHRQIYTALIESDPDMKCRLTKKLYQRAHLDSKVQFTPLFYTDMEKAAIPGRPKQPALVATTDVPKRSPYTPQGHAAMIHAIAHIEFNAINLALDAVWRFEGMPEQFYLDWLRVASEEAEHFMLLNRHLQTLGYQYGDFPAHQGLWQMAQKTQHDVLVRMALVPRVLEARGLDASPLILDKLRKIDDQAGIAILTTILQEEIGHVKIGNDWFYWCCDRVGIVDYYQHWQNLAKQFDAPLLRPPLNLSARNQANFLPQELLAWQQLHEQMQQAQKGVV